MDPLVAPGVEAALSVALLLLSVPARSGPGSSEESLADGQGEEDADEQGREQRGRVERGRAEVEDRVEEPGLDLAEVVVEVGVRGGGGGVGEGGQEDGGGGSEAAEHFDWLEEREEKGVLEVLRAGWAYDAGIRVPVPLLLAEAIQDL